MQSIHHDEVMKYNSREDFADIGEGELQPAVELKTSTLALLSH